MNAKIFGKIWSAKIDKFPMTINGKVVEFDRVTFEKCDGFRQSYVGRFTVEDAQEYIECAFDNIRSGFCINSAGNHPSTPRSVGGAL